MNLDSAEALTLFRNCAGIEIIKFQYDDNINVSDSTISEFNELFNALQSGDTEKILAQIQSSKSSEVTDFIKHFFQASMSDISKHYLDLAKTHLTPEQFGKIRSQFEKHIEPEIEHPAIEATLNNLRTRIHQNNPKLIPLSPTQFKSFLTDYRDDTKTLVQSKFQQYFSTQGQTVLDLQFLYDTPENSRPSYKTIIKLRDSLNTPSEVTVHEPAPAFNSVLNDYQAACYAYFKSDSSAQLDESSLTTENMTAIWGDLSSCYPKLVSMTKNNLFLCEGRIFVSDTTNFEPTRDELNKTPEFTAPHEYDEFSL